MVGAGVLLVAQIGLEVTAKGSALRALHIPFPDAVGHLCFQVKAGAVGIKIVIQRVVQLVFIHGQQLVTGRKAQRLGFAARFHTLDFDRQRIHLLCSDRTRRGRHRALPFCT